MIHNTPLRRKLFPLRRIPLHLRHSSTTVHPIPILPDGSLSTFRTHAFAQSLPFLLPRGHFSSLPAIKKWFLPPSLNVPYLSTYATTLVPLELTTPTSFAQTHQPLQLFLDSHSLPGVSIYLAQASISDLPTGLAADVPTPEIVRRAGKGDVYASSIWLGSAPTYTPLHRDPNPNLFVQLCGAKRVRLLPPHVGDEVFRDVQREVGGSGDARMRGEEMMHGPERGVLERKVWEEGREGMVECEMQAGDGVFIPLGWWHSVKGVGEGMIGSVRLFRYLRCLCEADFCGGQLVVPLTAQWGEMGPCQGRCSILRISMLLVDRRIAADQRQAW